MSILKRTTLRYAVEPTQGRGWSEYSGDRWLSPVERHGVLHLTDDNESPRHLILDRDDQAAFEFGTFDRTTALGLPYVDKEDVYDAEIGTAQWFGEEAVNPLNLQDYFNHQVSQIHVRPQNVYNKGNPNYGSEGYRSAQNFSLDIYADGSLLRPLASADEIPQDGFISFSGHHQDYKRLQFVIRSDASEFSLCGRKHNLVVKPKPGATADRTMLRDTLEVGLASKYYHISRYSTAMYERVSRATIPGVATLITGPDNRSESAMTLAAPTALLNTAFTGAYTFLFWRKTGVTVTGLPDTLLDYGPTHNGWQLSSARSDSNTLPALTISGGDVFDIRIYQSNLDDDYLAALHNDIIYNDGNGLLPRF